MSPLVEKVVEQLKTLPYELQWRVYEFTRALATSTPHGTPGQALLSLAGNIAPDDLQIMSQVIEQDCERVDSNEW